jgi:phospholipid/cholesterol/gamma-HCH transport system ATP-binding protein
MSADPQPLSATAQPLRGVRIEVRDLRKSYDSQLILKGINFAVERGEIFVIMGPSGSGKSVLLKHIIGLEKPDGGEILIEGESRA